MCVRVCTRGVVEGDGAVDGGSERNCKNSGGEEKKRKEGVHVVRVPFRFRDVIARQMWK